MPNQQRVIKFRAWDNWQKIMCYEVDVYSPGGDALWWTGQHRYPEGNKADFFDSNGNGNILMQFTGLHDKNGNEIWEGDIVLIPTGEESVKKIRCEIRWNQTDCAFVGVFVHVKTGYRDTLLDFMPSTMEVLGNIYQNPELLNA